MSKKRIQITSDFSSETEYFYQRVYNSSNGKTHCVEKLEPKTTTRTVNAKTNPYTIETGGSSPEQAKTKVSSKQTEMNEAATKSTTIDLEKKSYDTSQL
jgi:hypothetical protein